MKTAALELLLTGKDRVSPAFDSAGRGAKRFTRNATGSLKKLEKRAMSATKLVGSIMTAKVLSRGFAYGEMAFTSLAETIVTADQALTSASAKFGPSVQRGNAAFKELEATARDVAGTTEFTMKEVAEGYDFLAMAGFNYQQSLKAIRPLTELATASQMDLARASDIASDALGAFQLSMDPSVIERNLKRVNDVFAAAVTSRNVTMETMFDTMKHGGAAVTTGGGDIETFSALTGELGGAGIKGTKAGTTLKNMYVNVAVAAAKAGTAGGRALRNLGIEFRDPKNKKNMNDMVTILEQLNEETKDLGDIKRTKIIKDIFGKIALPGVKSLMGGEIIGRLREYRDSYYDTGDAAKTMADKQREGLLSQIKILKSAGMSRGMDIFSQLMGETDPAKAVGELTEKLREFDVKPVVEGLREIGSVIKNVAEFTWEYRDELGLLAKFFVSSKIVGSFMGLGAGGEAAAGGMKAATAAGPGLLGTMNLWVGALAVLHTSLQTIYGAYIDIQNISTENANSALEAEKLARGGDFSNVSAEELEKSKKAWMDVIKRDTSLVFGWDPNKEENDTTRKAAKTVYTAIHNELLRRDTADYNDKTSGSSDPFFNPDAAFSAPPPPTIVPLESKMDLNLNITGLPEGVNMEATDDTGRTTPTVSRADVGGRG